MLYPLRVPHRDLSNGLQFFGQRFQFMSCDSTLPMGDQASEEDQAMAEAIALSMQQENDEADAQQEDSGPVQMMQQIDSGPVQMMQQMDSGPVQQMDGGMENYGGAGNRFCSATMGGSCSFQGDGPGTRVPAAR